MESQFPSNKSGRYKSWNQPPCFPEFSKWSDMASKLVRYGLETGPICFEAISDQFRGHIGPVLRPYRTSLEMYSLAMTPPSSSSVPRCLRQN